MKIKERYKVWDVQDQLLSGQDQTAYLQAATEYGESDFTLDAIGQIARAQGLSEIATKLGVSRSGLYKSLGENGNPSFAVINDLLKELGYRIEIVPLKKKRSSSATK